MTALHARAANRARAVHRRLDARRAAGHHAGHLRRVSGRRHRAGAVGTAYARAAAVPDVPHEDARPRARHRQRQAVADVLPADRPARARRRSALRDQRRARAPTARRSSTALQQAFLDEDATRSGKRSCCRPAFRWARSTPSTGRGPSTGGRTRRAGRVRASGGRPIRIVGPPVRMSRHAGIGAHASAAPRASTRTKCCARGSALDDEEIARLRRSARDWRIRAIRNCEFGTCGNDESRLELAFEDACACGHPEAEFRARMARVRRGVGLLSDVWRL